MIEIKIELVSSGAKSTMGTGDERKKKKTWGSVPSVQRETCQDLCQVRMPREKKISSQTLY